jgi:hypothetical protein
MRQEMRAVLLRFNRLGLIAAVSALAAGVAAPPAHAESDMQRRIQEVRKRLEAERALPEAERWAMDEKRLDDLEARFAAGETEAGQFLELAQDRMKQARRQRLQKTWGRVLNLPDAPAELRTHALRVAQLKRVRFLAIQRRYPDYAQRATELLNEERQRHEQRMKEIAAELTGGQPASAGATP